METGITDHNDITQLTLKPSLVEWKRINTGNDVTGDGSLETFLGGMETGITDHNDITQLTP